MSIYVRPYTERDYPRVLDICIAAFEPIHQGFEQALGSKVFDVQYSDWRWQYAKTISGIPAAGNGTRVFVAELDGVVAGFVFTMVDEKRKTGEIGLNAVDPNLQRRGVGRAMYQFALKHLKERGAEVACVGTGGDAAHAAARRAYQALGFDRQIPGVYLFKLL